MGFVCISAVVTFLPIGFEYFVVGGSENIEVWVRVNNKSDSGLFGARKGRGFAFICVRPQAEFREARKSDREGD